MSGGRALGTGPISLVLLAAITTCVAFLARTRTSDIEPTPEPAR